MESSISGNIEHNDEEMIHCHAIALNILKCFSVILTLNWIDLKIFVVKRELGNP